MLSCNPPLHLDRTMGFQTIPDQNDRILNMTAKLLQENLHLGAVDICVRQQGKIKSYPSSFAGYGKSGNGRYLLIMARSLIQQRSFSFWGPTPPHQWCQQQTGFIQEDKRSFQAPCVFFTRGQSFLIQRWMASSSRSRARRSGFCGVHPIDRNRRQI